MQIDLADFRNFITLKEGLDISSVRHCMSRAKLFNQWLRENNKSITKQHIEEYFIYLKSERGLKNNSMNTYRFMFRHLVSYSKDRGLPYDFFEGFKSFKKTKSNIVVFTVEEMRKIIDTSLEYGKFYGKDTSFLDFRYRTLTQFLAETGCRFGEAANLKIENIDLSSGRVTFVDTKTDENRSTYITQPLISKIWQITVGFSTSDYVFRNCKEKQIHCADYSKDLKDRALKAGITKRVFPHNFRHSYVTLMLESDVPITEVATLVGHKDIQTTYDTYTHLADKTIKRAALRHPLVRNSMEPTEVIKSVREVIDNLHLENTSSIHYSITEGTGELFISIKAK